MSNAQYPRAKLTDVQVAYFMRKTGKTIVEQCIGRSVALSRLTGTDETLLAIISIFEIRTTCRWARSGAEAAK